MEEFPLVEISPAGPIKDAADFCRPLAAISGVNIAVLPGDADTTTVLSNDLRLQQVRMKRHHMTIVVLSLI